MVPSAFCGPDSSLPAMGWPPTKLTCLGSTSSAHCRTTFLELPTSVTTQPSSKSLAADSIISRIAWSGVANTTTSAPLIALARRDSTFLNAPDFWAPDRAALS